MQSVFTKSHLLPSIPLSIDNRDHGRVSCAHSSKPLAIDKRDYRKSRVHCVNSLRLPTIYLPIYNTDYSRVICI